MKKFTLLMLILFVSIGFSQTNRQIIQNHLDANRAKFGLSAQDISDWAIQSEVPGSGTGITSTYIVQRYNGTEIFNVQNNVWVKNGAVLNMENAFLSNVASRANATTPSLTALKAVEKAYINVGVTKTVVFAVSETIDAKNLKITDGLQEDPITAKLVYQPTQDNKLKLAWEFQFYAPQGDAWDVRVDAINGTILEKNNLTIKCNFEGHNHSTKFKTTSVDFEKLVQKKSLKTFAAVPGIPATYRVIPFNYESPNHHSFDLITTTGNLLASPNGWHDSNTETGTSAALRFTYTRGNNVWAKEDATGDNETTVSANVDGGSGLVFNFPYDTGVGQTQQPTTYTAASTTNLFYMNNIMHDVWYQYGFNEVSGNFQNKNLGRGGVTTGTGDYVLADSQDGYSQTTATLNNSNFSTLPDGSRPRMQMFLWTLGAPPTNFLNINSPSAIAGPRVATTNVFEGTDRIAPPPAPGISSDLVLYTNVPVHTGQSVNSACAPATNPFDISGKIVLLRRGGCFFSNKVKAAQDAGAIGVVVMDSIPMNPQRLSMSSTGLLGITVPAIFVTKEIGEELVTQMASGPVNVTIQTPANLYLYADGDFDNGIIAHEYGHGISNRLTGGPTVTTCMTSPEQMGEGWSDWFALMMQLKAGDVGTAAKGIGSFAINEAITGDGIRNFPYTTDMSINPLTFGALNGKIFPGSPPISFSSINTQVTPNVVEPHNTGEVWCAMLWDLTWAYIDKYGLDPNVYTGTGGNNKVMRLVLDAMKLQPCNMSYIQARDAIIAADQATTGGADYCMIWKVFARRGMGVGSSSGSNSGDSTNIAAITDEVESFIEPTAGPNCTLAVLNYNNENLCRIYPNPAKGTVNLSISKYIGKLNIQIIDVNGRIIENINDDNFNNQKTIDISNFNKGMYFIKVIGDALNYTEKVLIN